MNKIIKSFFIILALYTASCSPNVLSGSSSEGTDDYLIEQATKANNAQDYDTAIDILVNQVSQNAKETVTVKDLLASSYSGKCGLNFFEYTENLSDVVAGSAFNVMMQPFVGVESHPEYCLLALQTLDTLGAPGDRTASQNLFAAINGMVLMGTALRANADPDPVADNGDGTVDIDICDDTVMTDDEIDQVILGFGYFTTNISYVSADLIGGGSMGALDDMVDACEQVPGGADCSITDPDDISDATRLVIRNMLNTTEYGIGAVSVGNDPADILTACPP